MSEGRCCGHTPAHWTFDILRPPYTTFTNPRLRLQVTAWTVWWTVLADRRAVNRFAPDCKSDCAALEAIIAVAPIVVTNSCSQQPFAVRSASSVTTNQHGEASHFMSNCVARWTLRAWRSVVEVDLAVKLLSNQRSEHPSYLVARRRKFAAWRLWWVGFCGAVRLRAIWRQAQAEAACSAARAAIHRLRVLAKGAAVERERARLARHHLWRARVANAYARFKAIASEAQRRSLLRSRASVSQQVRLLRMPFSVWRVQLGARERADKCFISLLFRRWRNRNSDALRLAQALRWRCAWPRSCWRVWRTWTSKLKELCVVAEGRRARRGDIMARRWLMGWHSRVLLISEFVSRVATQFFTYLGEVIQMWRQLTSRRLASQAARSRLMTYLCTNRRTRSFFRWRLHLQYVDLKRRVETKIRSFVVRLAYDSLSLYCDAKRLRERRRRISTRFHYLRLLAKGINSLRCECSHSRQLPHIESVVSNLLQLNTRKRAFQSWCVDVLPLLRHQARRHYQGVLLQRSVACLKYRVMARVAKARDQQKVFNTLRTIIVRFSWSRLRKFVQSRAESRAAQCSQTLMFRLVSAKVACRRALRTWKVDFTSRRHLVAEQNWRARQLLLRCALRSVFATLQRRLSLRQVVRTQVCSNAQRRRSRACSIVFCQWTQIVLDLRCGRGRREEALLHWYLVLCGSALQHWCKWYARRQAKKAHQMEACRLFDTAARKNVGRMLLWRFDQKRSFEEAEAVVKASKFHEHRVEVVIAAAQHWKANSLP